MEMYIYFSLWPVPSGLEMRIAIQSEISSFTCERITHQHHQSVENKPRPSQWVQAEVNPRRLPWWGIPPSSYRSHVSTVPCRWPVPAGGSGLSCSSEPAGIPVLSRWSWCLEAAPPTGKATQLWRCCWTKHRWSTAPCCNETRSHCETPRTLGESWKPVLYLGWL